MQIILNLFVLSITLSRLDTILLGVREITRRKIFKRIEFFFIISGK